MSSVRFPCRLIRPICRPEQVERNRGPAAKLAIDRHVTARLLGEAVDPGESEPAAFAHVLGCKKRLEGAIEYIWFHAATRVAYRQHEAIGKD